MCQLMGMTFNQAVRPSLSFRGFQHRGAANPHGWGIAFYPDRAVRVLKEPIRADDSALSDFVRDCPTIKSQLFLAHVRLKSRGGLSYMDTHPFYRECLGKDYVFAHNGTLTGFEHELRLDNYYHPIGGTDSEHAFCYILCQIRQRSLRVWRQDDFAWLHEEFAMINRLGNFNCLMSNGEYLFCYHDRNRYNGLSMVERHSPFNSVRLEDEDYEIDLGENKDPAQRGYIIASHPLTDENWSDFSGGELMVFCRGDLIFSSAGRTSCPSGVKLNNMTLRILRFIREAPHAVDIEGITEGTGMPLAAVTNEIAALVDKAYIQQHSRDNVGWNNTKARYFTCEEKRNEIDQALINI